MKAFFETKLGKTILFALVAGIWGVNVINFSEMGSQEDGGQAQIYGDIMDDELVIPEFIKYEYRAGNRNPFSLPSDLRRNEARAMEQPEEESYRQPVVVLNGVMEGMAIVRDEAGQTFFVEENDTFNDISVKEIYQDSVRLVHQGRAFTITLNDM